MRFKSGLLFILAFLLTSCTPTTTQRVEQPAAQIEDSKTTVIEKGMNATIALVTTTADEKEITYPYCTAVWINRDTILTALHCMINEANFAQFKQLPPKLREFAPLLLERITDPTGLEVTYIVNNEVLGLEAKPKNTHTARVVAIDTKHDMAMLKADKHGMPTHTWLPIADHAPKVGKKVYVIGHPRGLYFTLMDGIVAAIRETYPMTEEDDEDFYVEGPLLQIFSGIYRGNSGGPVISEDGEIIGIVSFIARSPNQGFAIAPSAIKIFIFKAHRDKGL